MTDKATRLKEALQKRIDELKDAQFARASIVEKALQAYESNIRIKSVSDYIALSAHQRRLIGINDSKGSSIELPNANVESVEIRFGKSNS